METTIYIGYIEHGIYGGEEEDAEDEGIGKGDAVSDNGENAVVVSVVVARVVEDLGRGLVKLPVVVLPQLPQVFLLLLLTTITAH